MTDGKDALYAEPLSVVQRFQFDAAVAHVFPDMIARSVPGYADIIQAIGLLAGRFAQANSYCYDLGCSLGAATLSMRHNIQVNPCTIIAVDNSAAMIEQLQVRLAQDNGTLPVEVLCADIRELELRSASVVVLNFTLQFIPLVDREAFLHKVYQGVLPGGIVLLSEKLRFEDLRQQSLQTEMHHAFKKSQGYSDLEISQKRTALENVLLPETFSQHQQRLQTVGFSSVEVWFQYFNFASMIALK